MVIEFSPPRVLFGQITIKYYLIPDPVRDHRLQVEPRRDRQHARLPGPPAEGRRELRCGRSGVQDSARPQEERRSPQGRRRSEEVLPGGGYLSI